jgi:VWFA-related protein
VPEPAQRSKFLTLWSVVLACALSGVAATGAEASAPLSITHIDTSRFPAVRVTVNAARPSALRGLTVIENGHQITGLKLPDVHATTATALAVDTSQSMRGRRIHDVINAASAFVRLQHGNELLAVYGFAARPYQVSPFSHDRTSALAALKRVSVGGPTGTTIYAAIQMIAHDASHVTAARKSLVLVTDGRSFRDPATLSQAISAANAAHVAIYPVVIVTPVADLSALSSLAKETGGSIVTATKTSQLRRVYSALSQELGGTYSFTYQSRGSWATPNHLVISAPGLGQATATVKVPKPPSVTSKGPSVSAPTSMHARMLLVIGLMIGLAVAAIASVKVLDLVRR